MKKVGHITIFILLYTTTYWASCMKSQNDFGGSFGANCTPPDSTHILICKSKFTPGTLSVKKGTTVYWHNSDGIDHNVVSDNTIINSGNISTNSDYSYTTTFVGTFQYHCTIHQEEGVLIVGP